MLGPGLDLENQVLINIAANNVVNVNVQANANQRSGRAGRTGPGYV